MKKQNGITLIALVITIIVMLILVGVSVTVALKGGLFKTAKSAADQTTVEKDREYNLSTGRVKIGGVWYDSFEKYEQEIPSDNQEDIVVGGNSTGVKVEISPKKESYEIGEEVTIGNEHFFVIEDTAEQVKLLAKYNLNLAGTAQSNVPSDETNCKFSSINYWKDDWVEELDLNTYPIPAGETSVIITAKEYGLAVTGNKEEGRLLRVDEYEELIKNEAVKLKIYGRGYDVPNNLGLLYWMSRDAGQTSVYYVHGHRREIGYGNYAYAMYAGVRPVIDFSKVDM